MCEKSSNCIHNFVGPKDAVEAYLVAKERRHVCGKRLFFLEKQMDKVEDFDEVWCDTKERLNRLWTEDQVEANKDDDIMLNTVRTAPKGYMLDEDEDTMDIIPSRMPYYNVHDKLEGMFINHAIKGTSKYWKIKQYQWVRTAIEIEDKIVECLKPIHEVYLRDGRLPLNTWKLLKKYKKRVNDLRLNLGNSVVRKHKGKIKKEGYITYTQWAMLSNWINRMLSDKRRYKYNDDEDLHQLLESKLDQIIGCGEMPDSYEDKEQDKVLCKLEKEETARRAEEIAMEECLIWEEWRKIGYPVK